MNKAILSPLILAAALNGCATTAETRPQTPKVITVSSATDTKYEPEDQNPGNEPLVSDQVQELLDKVPAQINDVDEAGLWHTTRQYFRKPAKNGADGKQVYNECRDLKEATQCRDIWYEEYEKACARNHAAVERCTQEAREQGIGDNEWHECVMERWLCNIFGQEKACLRR